MISIEQAQRAIFEQITALETEQVPVSRALNRITPENHVAPWDLPAADNSAMDGFAFRHQSTGTVALKIAGFLPAGEVIDEPVPPGCAIRIMTGAPIPPGCDTVVPIEDAEVEGDLVKLKAPVKAGSHVRRRGEDIARGDVVIPAGSVLRPQEIGMLCAMGKTTLTVYRKAKVAILATGDELLEPGSSPSPGKLVNSNSYSLAAQVMEAGGEPVVLGIAADTLTSTCEKIRAGMDADLLVITGGVSVGDRDYVKAAIEQLGGEIKFWKVNMKPGKPLAFASLDGKPIFALPGNPVAAMVSFELFVRPSLLKAMGHRRILRPVVNALLQERAVNKGERPHLVRGVVSRHGDQYRVSTTGNQSSGRLSSLTLGNGLMKLAPESSYEAGCQVEVVLLDRWFEQGEIEQAGFSACQPEVSQ